MLSQPLRTALETAIGRATGAPFTIRRATAAPGGCIHSSWVLESGDVRYFAKTNDAGLAATFAAEADGLVALAGEGLRVPRPIAQGEADGKAFLVLEHLALARGTNAAFRELGCGLARLHSHRGDGFGWHRDNFIGLTPQPNARHASWAEFWQRERLGPQLELAARNGYRGELQSLGRRVMDAVPQLLAGHAPAPSLLHGDLWSGNAAFLADGTPIVFDPAVYNGDAETDLAMTELFGGFPERFYEGYRELRPIDEGYPLRRVLYNLYHVLNHLNLFGEGYRAQAESMMEQLLGG
ncbi:MAG TPA: fructosamine kinase family protein [Burkholderiales bacterium]|nr:fructosamine kinase family protein [Burkholderiales bacterium]